MRCSLPYSKGFLFFYGGSVVRTWHCALIALFLSLALDHEIRDQLGYLVGLSTPGRGPALDAFKFSLELDHFKLFALAVLAGMHFAATNLEKTREGSWLHDCTSILAGFAAIVVALTILLEVFMVGVVGGGYEEQEGLAANAPIVWPLLIVDIGFLAWLVSSAAQAGSRWVESMLCHDGR
jgi:hypothetical protein